jgi:hypothetical protein
MSDRIKKGLSSLNIFSKAPDQTSSDIAKKNPLNSPRHDPANPGPEENKCASGVSSLDSYTKALFSDLESVGTAIRTNNWSGLRISKNDVDIVLDAVRKRIVDSPATIEPLKLKENEIASSDKATGLSNVFASLKASTPFNANVSPATKVPLSDIWALVEKYKVVDRVKATASDLLDLVPPALLNDDMKTALRDLARVSENFAVQLLQLNLSFQHPYLVNLGLLRLYDRKMHSMDKSHYAQALKEDSGEVAENILAHALYFIKQNIAATNNDLQMPSRDILLNELASKKSAANLLPSHVVYLDHLTKQVVVSIVGTKSAHDVLIDLKLDSRKLNLPPGSPLKNVRAHRGMADSSEALAPRVEKCIKKAHSMNNGQFKNYGVTFTGHSLGGATAILLSLLISPSLNVPVTTYAFAPPPVVDHPCRHADINANASSIVSKLSHKGLSMYTFVHNFDIICRVSHREALNLISILKGIDSAPWSAAQRLGMLIRGEMNEREVREAQTAVENREDILAKADHAQLLLPGDIFWLRPIDASTNSSGPAKYIVQRIENRDELSNVSVFCEDTIVLDHFIEKYRDALINRI